MEEYNPDTDTWRVVCQVARRRYVCIGTSVEGVFYVIGGLKIGGGPGLGKRDTEERDRERERERERKRKNKKMIKR